MDNQYSYNPEKKLFFQCDICGKTYPYEMVHPKEIPTSGYESIYACDVCARIILLSVCISKMCYLSKENRETYFPFLRKKENNDA